MGKETVTFNEQLEQIYDICQKKYNKYHNLVEYDELCVIAEETLCLALMNSLERRVEALEGPTRRYNGLDSTSIAKEVKRALNRFIQQEHRQHKRFHLTDRMN